MDELNFFNRLYAPVPCEPLLKTLSEKLNCFFTEDFSVSYDVFLKVISEYQLLENPDFFIEVDFDLQIKIRFIKRF